MTKRNLGIGLLALGALVVPLLLCCGAVAISALLDQTADAVATGISLLLCFVAPLALIAASSGGGGVWLLRQGRADQLRLAVLDIAQANGGRVTASEVALHTALKIEEAAAYLDSLARQGICELHYTESGAICYLFPMGAARQLPPGGDHD